MTELDAADALVILTKIKTFHHPQDTGDAVCKSWAEAFNVSRVTNVGDAVRAVVLHYASPGADQWITPGDVVARYREIRHARIEGVTPGELTPDIDPDDIRGYIATAQARTAAVMDGLSVEAAIVAVKPVAAITSRS